MSDAIPPTAIRDIARVSDLAVSPDGSRVALVVNEYDASDDETYSSILTVPTDGATPPHRLTRVGDASSPKWSPSGNRLAFLAERDVDVERRVTGDDEADEDTGDDHDEKDTETQVWAFDLHRGGDPRQLTARDPGVREFDWGPGGDRIVFSARDPTDEQEAYLERREDDGPIEVERLQHKADGVGFTDDVTTYLFVLDVEEETTRRLDEAYGDGPFEPIRGMMPAWHPTDDVVAFIATRGERPDDSTVSDVFAVDVDSGDVERWTDEGYAFGDPAWSPAGSVLAVTGPPADNFYAPSDVFVVESATGAVRCLTEDFDPAVPLWNPGPAFLDEETVLSTFGDAGWTRLYRIPVDDGGPAPYDTRVRRDQSVRLFDIEGGSLAWSLSDPGDGHDVYAGDPADPHFTATRLTTLNESFVGSHPMPHFSRIESSSGEVTVESMVYYPDSFDPNDPDPHPLIVSPHGGPMSFDDPEFRFDPAFFTSRGYLICKPNYRGSTSYGQAFGEALYANWGSVEVRDILAVVDDLVDRGWAAAHRLFSMGFSYGGMATAYLITQTDRFAAAVAEHGSYDLYSEFGTGDSQAHYTEEFGLPWEHPEVYEAASSIRDVGGVTTPTLVTAGARDWRCPPTQAEELYVSIKKQGVPSKLVVYPKEHHNIGKPERAIHRLEELTAWLERFDPEGDGS